MRQRAKVAFTATAQQAVTSIVLDNYSDTVEHCINLVAQNPGLQYIVITREDGFSLIHTRQQWAQDTLSGIWTPGLLKGKDLGTFTETPYSTREVFHLTYPLSYSGIDWGWIHLGLSPDKFFNDLRLLYFRTFITTILAVGGGLLASFLYAQRISVPILKLDQFAKDLAEGDQSRRIKLETGDEVQSLSESFNHMLDELNRSNKVLIKSARQAGMAEVATNVLHNVGNVLNSVGVTAQDLKRTVSNSKMTALKPVVGLIQENEADLPHFFTKSSKGQKIPTYLGLLSDQLVKDHQHLIKRVEELEGHIQHIKDIVHLQQNYSQTIGMTEPVQVKEVISDAIALNSDSIQIYDIHIEKDFITVPRILLDRRKLLQIVTNLINNAIQAVHESSVEHRTVSIRLYYSSPETLGLDVKDNGTGIAAENLTRIFQHGFTTRKDGHGFGLHGAAIAASEMQGNLVAKSPGPDMGATFSLELPVRTFENDYETT